MAKRRVRSAQILDDLVPSFVDFVQLLVRPDGVTKLRPTPIDQLVEHAVGQLDVRVANKLPVRRIEEQLSRQEFRLVQIVDHQR